MAAESPNEGLQACYRVEKIDDPAGKHADCQYFVLDPQHDPLARRTLSYYAALADDAGNRQLCEDIREWLRDIEVTDNRQKLLDEYYGLRERGEL